MRYAVATDRKISWFVGRQLRRKMSWTMRNKTNAYVNNTIPFSFAEVLRFRVSEKSKGQEQQMNRAAIRYGVGNVDSRVGLAKNRFRVIEIKIENWRHGITRFDRVPDIPRKAECQHDQRKQYYFSAS